MSDSKNSAENCDVSENEGIGSPSETELGSGYLSEPFQGIKLEPNQYESSSS